MSEERRIVTASPENSETPLHAVSSWVTPTRLFFVRNHFGVPEIDPAAWRLSIEGLVDRPLSLSLEDLRSMPQETVFATLECAGNGRSFLRPAEHGVQWGAGAIAHAEWTGVPLSLVLQDAAPKAEAREVVFVGEDRGTEADHPQPMNFARSLPLDKATSQDTLLVLSMNGEPLEPIHGFPVRLLVPGWYGVAAVKWLSRIEVVDAPFEGYFQTKKYTVLEETAAGRQRVGLRQMAVKAEIIRPRPDEVLAPGEQRISGVAWAGEDGIARVEVSTDGGGSWQPADLAGPKSPYSWTLWQCEWQADTPGDYSILARATSTTGQQQPMAHDPLRGGYMINFCQPRHVRIDPAAQRPEYLARRDAESLLYDINAFTEENARLPLDVELHFSDGAGI